jgi:copper chaperone NosL
MRRALLAAALVALVACEDERAATRPPPAEILADATGHYCGMGLGEHAGPKGQIFLEGSPAPIWFSSVRDAFAFTMLPEEPKDIAAIYVNDMGRAARWEQPEPGTWIDAETAWYVIGSSRKGGMGAAEAIPFGEEAAARGFAAANGGEIVAFSEMPRDYILGSDSGPQ